jgi:hypothetical protein
MRKNYVGRILSSNWASLHVEKKLPNWGLWLFLKLIMRDAGRESWSRFMSTPPQGLSWSCYMCEQLYKLRSWKTWCGLGLSLVLEQLVIWFCTINIASLEFEEVSDMLICLLPTLSSSSSSTTTHGEFSSSTTYTLLTIPKK